MANSAKNDNGSQFFITLDHAEELDKKHTLFGKVGRRGGEGLGLLLVLRPAGAGAAPPCWPYDQVAAATFPASVFVSPAGSCFHISNLSAIAVVSSLLLRDTFSSLLTNTKKGAAGDTPV